MADRDAEKIARLAAGHSEGDPSASLRWYQRAAMDFTGARLGEIRMRTISKSVALAAPYGERPVAETDKPIKRDYVSGVYDPDDGEPPPFAWPSSPGDPTPRPAHYVSRSDVPAALDTDRPQAPPYLFKGQPCTLTQLRVLLADAAQFDGMMPRILMDDRAIHLREETTHFNRPPRNVQFTRTINADGISVIDPEWFEE